MATLGVSAPAGFSDLSHLSLTFPTGSSFKDRQARHSCCVMLFTTLDTLRYKVLCFVEVCPQDKPQQRGQKEGTCLYLERLWKHVRAGMGGQAHRPRFQGFCMGKSSLVTKLQTPRTPRCCLSPQGWVAFPKSHVHSPSLLGNMEAPRKQAPLFH